MAEEKSGVLPEVEVISSSVKPAKVEPTPDDIPSRPTSVVSRSSVSSVTTKKTGYVRLTKYVINNYFSYREGAFDSAVSECKTSTVTSEDGQVIGTWLLMEIDQWDCEKEKLVILTENSLLVIRYDFVKNRVYKEKRMPLTNIINLKAGDLVYPSSSFMPPRDHGGVRIARDKEENAGFLTRWSWSGAANMPYWTFCHHRLIYMEGEEDNPRYNVDNFYDAVCDQVQALGRKSSGGKEVEMTTGDIMIYTYMSLTSLIYNQSSLGFSKERGGVNY